MTREINALNKRIAELFAEQDVVRNVRDYDCTEAELKNIDMSKDSHDFKITKYTFNGQQVYRHNGLYVLATGQFVMRRDLSIKK